MHCSQYLMHLLLVEGNWWNTVWILVRAQTSLLNPVSNSTPPPPVLVSFPSFYIEQMWRLWVRLKNQGLCIETQQGGVEENFLQGLFWYSDVMVEGGWGGYVTLVWLEWWRVWRVSMTDRNVSIWWWEDWSLNAVFFSGGERAIARWREGMMMTCLELIYYRKKLCTFVVWEIRTVLFQSVT